MRVKGMQQSASIRSLSARDSRKELVTVRRRRLRSSTATTRAFPQTLSTKISAYSRTRTVRSSSAGARSRAARRARDRLHVPALRCARELLRPSLRRTRCQDAVPRGPSSSTGTAGGRRKRGAAPLPEAEPCLSRVPLLPRTRPRPPSPGAERSGAGITRRWHPRARAVRWGDGAGGSLGFRASLPPPLGTLAAPAQSEPTPGPPCAEHRLMLGTRRTGRERLPCAAPRCAPSRPVPSRPLRSHLWAPAAPGGPCGGGRRRSRSR